MKILPGFIAVLTLSSAISLSASAAEKPISVQIDQQKLNLTTTNAPLNDGHSILVPMRPIFEKLGLKLVFDAKTSTITATKEGLTIKLQIGSKNASINGIIKPLQTAPKMVNNVTYVPVRFVSEATGNNVVWNATTRTVEITSLQSSVDTAEIADFFKKFVSYSNEENYDGFMSLIDSKSPLAQIGPQLKEQYATYELKNTVDQMNIIDVKTNEVTVHTIESSEKVSGPFMPNSQSENVYSLTRSSKDSGWKISNVQVQAMKYSLPEGVLNAAVTVPQTDEAAIKAVFAANIDFTNKEDLEGVQSTIDESSPAYEQNKVMAGQVFQAYDLQTVIESSKIIDYTGNEAAIYSVQTTKKLKGPQFQDNRTTMVTTLKKSADGKWKLVQSYPLSAEALTK
ncbi:copper amine oxidase N-terminal domain-containing protein [Paenibacillus pedocola]|uniref:copper amine oxidase N-terminal domain-containing protein n=1 Tax=Paenibacillus pedocola TaxID=3242193 RepID=UPI002877B047|nr:copper amine oxidase N-terminal domain-containing protein [Paenibacillus typhae]